MTICNYEQLFVAEAKKAGSNDRGAALVFVDSLRRTNETRFPRASMALRCIARKRLRELGTLWLAEERAKVAIATMPKAAP